MQLRPLVLLAALAGTAAVALSASAAAQGDLVVYCGVQEEWCRAITTAFEKETGIKVAMTRKSAGEVYAQVRAEASNPKGDIWWGGTGDPHLQAVEEGLAQPYTSPNMGQQHEWATRLWDTTKGQTIGIYSGALGFGFNTKTLAQKKLPEPKCWADLIDPKYKDEVQVADPNSSGTAYNLIATVMQVMGEEKGWDYMKALHKNINQYTKSGAAPANAVSLGESAIGITFMHDMIAQKNPDVKTIAPCEGTGYEIGSMTILKGARNLDNAKKFYDFALLVPAQSLAAENKQLQIQSNKATPLPPNAPKLTEIKLITYDFAKYGSSAERKRLLTKWSTEVKPLAK